LIIKLSTGKEIPVEMHKIRIVPRRVYTVSHAEYAADRVGWLYKKRNLVKGLRFVEELSVLRFFFGKLEAIDDWGARLAEEFKKEFGTNYQKGLPLNSSVG